MNRSNLDNLGVAIFNYLVGTQTHTHLHTHTWFSIYLPNKNKEMLHKCINKSKLSPWQFVTDYLFKYWWVFVLTKSKTNLHIWLKSQQRPRSVIIIFLCCHHLYFNEILVPSFDVFFLCFPVTIEPLLVSLFLVADSGSVKRLMHPAAKLELHSKIFRSNYSLTSIRLIGV